MRRITRRMPAMRHALEDIASAAVIAGFVTLAIAVSAAMAA
jgi:hypothetical protein